MAKIITIDELKKMLVGKVIINVEGEGDGSLYDETIHFNIGDYDQPGGSVIIYLSDGSRISASSSEWGSFLYFPPDAQKQG